MKKLYFDDQTYKIIDTKEKITIADSFVVRQNKIGLGNGEAKLYIGHDNVKNRHFFGQKIEIQCFLLKTDLIEYLNQAKAEYLNPEQLYINREALPNLWENRQYKISQLPEKIEFNLHEQTQIDGPRVYVKSNDKAYKLIRELSLPNITYISILKLRNSQNSIEYYFRLFVDYFGEVEHPESIRKQQENIENSSISEKQKVDYRKARLGQGKYRIKLLESCPVCPITLVSDDRILIASHIKPWSQSSEKEKMDPMNGLMLTPTFDYLFDRGFLSFTEDKKSILSPFLSNMTYKKIGISDGKNFPHLPIEGREHYLNYHRSNILKR